MSNWASQLPISDTCRGDKGVVNDRGREERKEGRKEGRKGRKKETKEEGSKEINVGKNASSHLCKHIRALKYLDYNKLIVRTII